MCVVLHMCTGINFEDVKLSLFFTVEYSQAKPAEIEDVFKSKCVVLHMCITCVNFEDVTTLCALASHKVATLIYSTSS